MELAPEPEPEPLEKLVLEGLQRFVTEVRIPHPDEGLTPEELRQW